MGKKRFYETISPQDKTLENQTKKTKNKSRSGMASNTSSQSQNVNKTGKSGVQNPQCDNNSPGFNQQMLQTPGNGNFILPSVLQVPQYMMNSGSPVLNQSQNSNMCATMGAVGSPTFSTDVLQNLQSVMSKLQSIESKLGKLDLIQVSVQELTSRLNSMDVKIGEIEASQKFISSQYDDVSTATGKNSSDIGQLQSKVRALSNENSKLQSDKQQIQEDIIDLKCRSMRDNLMFYGLSEGPSLGILSQFPQLKDHTSDASGPLVTPEHQPDRVQESQTMSEALRGAHSVLYSDVCQREPVFDNDNCEEKVLYFCEKVLKIPDAKSSVLIDRAHRVGNPAHGKVRPIVVKFKDTASKMSVKNALKNVKLKGTNFNVGEQFPQEVQQRRRELIPVMIEARNQNRRAVLVRDKLFIDNKLYTPPNGPPSAPQSFNSS